MGQYVFGVDIGGTTVKLGLFNKAAELLDKWEIPTVKVNGGEQILPDVAKSILKKMEEKGIAKSDIIGIGVGAPGAVDEEGTGIVGIPGIEQTGSLVRTTISNSPEVGLELLVVIHILVIDTLWNLSDKISAFALLAHSKKPPF